MSLLAHRIQCSIKMQLFLILSSIGLIGVAADSRCFLEGGGSAESFFVSEDLPVGSIVGTLSILGDPRITGGDITLGLRERDSPVQIAAGTRDLVLRAPLDKEGRRGPASVYVNVICDRRLSGDPSFVIPVNIRVSDANDNAPQWIGAPYTLTLSEVTVPGTRVLQGARAIDADQQGPFSTVEYTVLPGPHSDIFAFVTPLEGTLILRKPLDYETMPNFTVGLRAQDQGNPPKFSDTKLDVFVADADDQNPKFLDEAYTAVVPEGGLKGAVLRTLPRSVGAIDQDAGLRASLVYSLAPPAPTTVTLFKVDSKTAALSLAQDLRSGDLLQPVTLVLKATQSDNPDRYALATLIVSRAGYGPTSGGAFRAPLVFLQSELRVETPEDSAVGTRLIILPTNRPGDPAVRYSLIEPGCRGLFAVSPSGEVLLRAGLDYEAGTRHRCHILATDGRTNATALMDVSVINVNDWEPRFRRSHYEFLAPGVPGARGTPATTSGLLLGRLEAADGDRGDSLTLTLRGTHSNLFSLDPSGALFLRPGAMETLLGAQSRGNQSIVVHLVATATDSGVPPRSSSVPITVHIGGTPITSPGVVGRGASTNRGNILGDWGLVTAFTALLGLFAVVIAGLSVYIYKVKKPKRSARNRIHVNDTGGFLRSQQKPPQHTIGGLGMIGGALGRGATGPGGPLGGSESTLSAGASTIIANSLERRAQADYTATVRSIMSRASQRAGMYDCGGGSPTPDASELSGTTSAVNRNGEQGRAATGLWVQGTGIPGRTKKLSWENGHDVKTDDDQIHNPSGSNLAENLTVYF